MFSKIGNVKRIGQSTLLLAGGIVAGAMIAGGGPDLSVRADVRPGEEREAFLSGGARSIKHLEDISATLKRIEAQLEKMNAPDEGPVPPGNGPAGRVGR